MTETQTRRDDPRVLEASKLWRAGETMKAIAEKTGVPSSTLGGWPPMFRDLFPKRDYRTGGAFAKNAANVMISIRAKKAKAAPRMPPKAPQYLVCEETGEETKWFHEGRTARELPACGCTFPLWGDHEYFNTETSLFCGAPKTEKEYCQFHADRAYGRNRGEGAAA